MAVTYRALALFLTYPTEGLKTGAHDYLAAIRAEGLVSDPLVRALSKLADELAREDIYALQENYVQLFDRTRSLSLNLYEHVHGESRDRGQAMADLVELYQQNGLELDANELPDFLPVFLDYLSTRPDAEAASLLGEAAHVLDAMGERLKKRDSPYRGVFGALCALAGGADREAVAALLSEPDDNPDDLEAIDKAWEETAVTFGPGDAGCPKAEALVAAMRAGPDPAAETLKRRA
ncbi:MAG TPA: nitrate reductase molybdenum cofactor assembly chaperone [Brevundimonas sp.]|uniref:nitrate reductase molybdenum cofactor assembly chaperone n=1 Tax=Brevundimonas sp. TaxID=1871086 RepID=UPI0026214B7B|nr:nitrate reductase molybdenum cofactor assembly chaperone [Brevundimonas sp.]HRO32098.1 nitrate reductase molybdenum cofactor assembly chaperone [Brevundimonas sp.]